MAMLSHTVADCPAGAAFTAVAEEADRYYCRTILFYTCLCPFTRAEALFVAPRCLVWVSERNECSLYSCSLLLMDKLWGLDVEIQLAAS